MQVLIPRLCFADPKSHRPCQASELEQADRYKRCVCVCVFLVTCMLVDLLKPMQCSAGFMLVGVMVRICVRMGALLRTCQSVCLLVCLLLCRSVRAFFVVVLYGNNFINDRRT